MRRSMGIMLLALAALPACSKKGNGGGDEGAQSAQVSKASNAGATSDGKSAARVGAAAAEASAAGVAVGVEAGGIVRDRGEGPSAVLSAVEKTVDIRRVGEAEFRAAKASQPLYAGDQVRAAEGAAAKIVFADESVMEVAEVSTVGVGSRVGSADPASSAAVLAGLARFTVSARVPGEGAFRVYTPSGVILTRGTAYGVGVAANGEARVGVESGSVEVIGLADVAAPPVAVEAGAAATLEADGKVAQPGAWTGDDWGAWRGAADAEVAVGAAIQSHASALDRLSAELTAAYADLETTAVAVSSFEAAAAADAQADKVAEYEAALPDGAANIEASFGVAGNVEALTWAHAGHAEIATELYARHPEAAADWTLAAPQVNAAILWPKRFEVTTAAYLEPLRVQYYVHHPRGRLHAPFVGVAVPPFYAKVDPPEVDFARVRGRIKTPVWAPPVVTVQPAPRPVWIAAPQADWKAKVKVQPAPARAAASWYVRPPALHAKVLVGADVKTRFVPAIVVKPPEPRATLRAHFLTRVQAPVGLKIKVGPPDLAAAADARVKVKLKGGLIVRDHREAPDLGGAAGRIDVKVRDHREAAGKLKAHVDAKVPDPRPAVGGVKAKVGGVVKAGLGVKVKAPVLKVKAPVVEVKKPKVDVKAKAGINLKAGAKGGFKIGP